MNQFVPTKKQKFAPPPIDPTLPVCPFDNLLMLDFEATTEFSKFDYPHEIIQIGVTVLYGPGPEWKTDASSDFLEFVKPVINPKLSEACIQLTNITQDQVDKADTFPQVFRKFQNWLEDTGLSQTNFVVVTDGRQDMWKLAQYQFIYWDMQLPVYFKRFIDAFRVFTEQNPIIPRIIVTKALPIVPIYQRPYFGKFQDARRFEKGPLTLEYSKSDATPLNNFSGMRNGRAVNNNQTIMSHLDKMCQRFGIQRDSRVHDALGDATTLRHCVEKMLQQKRKFFYNYVLTCEFETRERPNFPQLKPGWRSDWKTSMQLLERVLPLFSRRINWQDNDAFECRKCGKSVEECGTNRIHSQFREDLFNGETDTFGPIECAVHLNLDKKHYRKPESLRAADPPPMLPLSDVGRSRLHAAHGTPGFDFWERPNALAFFVQN